MVEEIKYVKGGKPQDMDAAKGGLVLKRNQNFYKDENDDMHPLGTGLLGPCNDQSYANSTTGGKDPRALRKGDKSLPAIKPRK